MKEALEAIKATPIPPATPLLLTELQEEEEQDVAMVPETDARSHPLKEEVEAEAEVMMVAEMEILTLIRTLMRIQRMKKRSRTRPLL